MGSVYSRVWQGLEDSMQPPGGTSSRMKLRRDSHPTVKKKALAIAEEMS